METIHPEQTSDGCLPARGTFWWIMFCYKTEGALWLSELTPGPTVSAIIYTSYKSGLQSASRDVTNGPYVIAARDAPALYCCSIYRSLSFLSPFKYVLPYSTIVSSLLRCFPLPSLLFVVLHPQNPVFNL